MFHLIHSKPVVRADVGILLERLKKLQNNLIWENYINQQGYNKYYIIMNIWNSPFHIHIIFFLTYE